MAHRKAPSGANQIRQREVSQPLDPAGLPAWVAAAWWLEESDREMVLRLLELRAEREALADVVKSSTDWRDRVALRNLDSEIRSSETDLLLHPRARSAAGLPLASPVDPLDAMRQRIRAVSDDG